jgi:hypothetical protein
VWVGGVLTLALAGGATAVGLTTNTRYDQLSNGCGKTTGGCSDASVNDIRTRSRAVNLLAALAGVSAVATGIAFFATSSEAGATVAMRF